MARLLIITGLLMSMMGCTSSSFYVESDVPGVAEYVGLAHAKVQSRFEPTCNGGGEVKVEAGIRSRGGTNRRTTSRYNFDFQCGNRDKYYR
jgi:hypothetical protein